MAVDALSKSIDAENRDLIMSIMDENSSALTDGYNFSKNFRLVFI